MNQTEVLRSTKPSNVFKTFCSFFPIDYCLRRVVPLYKMLLEGVDVEVLGKRSGAEMCHHLLRHLMA
jgi:hypothetical protein